MELYRTSQTTHLPKESAATVRDQLFNLAAKLNISAVLLVNSAGQIIAKHITETWQNDAVSMAVLSANTYAAANEMARIINEDNNFVTVLHEGITTSVLTSAVNSGYFLVVVFPRQTTLGLVRLFTKKTVEQLGRILAGSSGYSRKEQSDLGQEFQNMLSRELDRAFKD